MKFNKVVKENISNSNGFLIACISCIVLLLTLCFFGVGSSFKGTSAASDAMQCLNGKIRVNSGDEVYCCSSSDMEIINHNYTNYCMPTKNKEFQYVSYPEVKDKNCSDEYSAEGKRICEIVYNGCIGLSDEECKEKQQACIEREQKCTPTDNYVCIYNNGFNQKENTFTDVSWRPAQSCSISCGAAVGECNKYCGWCYSLNAAAEEPIVVGSETNYCLKDNSSGLYYYGKFSAIGGTNYSGYSHIAELDNNEKGCLRKNKAPVRIVHNNHQKDYDDYTMFKLVQPEKKTITVVASANGISGLIIGDYSAEYFPKFKGWKVIKNTGDISFATSSRYCEDNDWKSLSDGQVVADSCFADLNMNPNGLTKLEAQWETQKIVLPTVKSNDGRTCKWNTKADGSGEEYKSGGTYTTANDTPSELKLFAVCDDSGGASGVPDEKKLTMSFDANGGVLNGDASKSCTATDDNGCLVVGLPTATKYGYEFKGWNNKSSCVSGYYNQVRIKTDVTYYACWVKEVSDEDNISPIKITFDYNDGSGREEDASCVPSGKYGKCEVAFPNITHREYEEYGDEYKLLGWDTQDTCGQYTTEDAVSVDQNLKYYACWEKVDSDNESSTGNDHSSSNNSPSGGSSSNNGDSSNQNDLTDADGNVTENSKTGDTAIMVVLLASLIAIGYSVYYFREIKSI